jgi:hypothetical protein
VPRDFPVRFRRVINGPFAGDAPPVGVQVPNDPVSGIGALFEMLLGRRDSPDLPTFGFQGYFKATGFAGTCTFQLWLNSRHGDAIPIGDWTRFGDPSAAIAALRLFESFGRTEDADAFVQVTPSVALVALESVELFLEEVGA